MILVDTTLQRGNNHSGILSQLPLFLIGKTETDSVQLCSY